MESVLDALLQTGSGHFDDFRWRKIVESLNERTNSAAEKLSQSPCLWARARLHGS
jgi:hypothetical protein